MTIASAMRNRLRLWSSCRFWLTAMLILTLRCTRMENSLVAVFAASPPCTSAHEVSFFYRPANAPADRSNTYSYECAYYGCGALQSGQDDYFEYEYRFGTYISRFYGTYGRGRGRRQLRRHLQVWDNTTSAIRLAQLAQDPYFGYTGHFAGSNVLGTGNGGEVGVLQIRLDTDSAWGTVCSGRRTPNVTTSLTNDSAVVARAACQDLGFLDGEIRNAEELGFCFNLSDPVRFAHPECMSDAASLGDCELVPFDGGGTGARQNCADGLLALQCFGGYTSILGSGASRPAVIAGICIAGAVVIFAAVGLSIRCAAEAKIRQQALSRSSVLPSTEPYSARRDIVQLSPTSGPPPRKMKYPHAVVDAEVALTSMSTDKPGHSPDASTSTNARSTASGDSWDDGAYPVRSETRVCLPFALALSQRFNARSVSTLIAAQVLKGASDAPRQPHPLRSLPKTNDRISVHVPKLE